MISGAVVSVGPIHLHPYTEVCLNAYRSEDELPTSIRFKIVDQLFHSGYCTMRIYYIFTSISLCPHSVLEIRVLVTVLCPGPIQLQYPR